MLDWKNQLIYVMNKEKEITEDQKTNCKRFELTFCFRFGQKQRHFRQKEN